LFLWFFLLVYLVKLKTQKDLFFFFVWFLFASSLPFLEKQKLQKDLLSSLFFSFLFLVWFFLGSFFISFALFLSEFFYLLRLVLYILVLGFKIKCQALPTWMQKTKYFRELLIPARCCLRNNS
jgi:hypothetical protein